MSSSERQPPKQHQPEKVPPPFTLRHVPKISSTEDVRAMDADPEVLATMQKMADEYLQKVFALSPQKSALLDQFKPYFEEWDREMESVYLKKTGKHANLSVHFPYLDQENAFCVGCRDTVCISFELVRDMVEAATDKNGQVNVEFLKGVYWWTKGHEMGHKHLGVFRDDPLFHEEKKKYKEMTFMDLQVIGETRAYDLAVETECDRFAVEMMVEARISPKYSLEAIDILDRAQKKIKRISGDLEDRIQQLDRSGGRAEDDEGGLFTEKQSSQRKRDRIFKMPGRKDLSLFSTHPQTSWRRKVLEEKSLSYAGEEFRQAGRKEESYKKPERVGYSIKIAPKLPPENEASQRFFLAQKPWQSPEHREAKLFTRLLLDPVAATFQSVTKQVWETMLARPHHRLPRSEAEVMALKFVVADQKPTGMSLLALSALSHLEQAADRKPNQPMTELLENLKAYSRIMELELKLTDIDLLPVAALYDEGHEGIDPIEIAEVVLRILPPHHAGQAEITDIREAWLNEKIDDRQSYEILRKYCPSQKSFEELETLFEEDIDRYISHNEIEGYTTETEEESRIPTKDLKRLLQFFKVLECCQTDANLRLWVQQFVNLGGKISGEMAGTIHPQEVSSCRHLLQAMCCMFETELGPRRDLHFEKIYKILGQDEQRHVVLLAQVGEILAGWSEEMKAADKPQKISRISLEDLRGAILLDFRRLGRVKNYLRTQLIKVEDFDRVLSSIPAYVELSGDLRADDMNAMTYLQAELLHRFFHEQVASCMEETINDLLGKSSAPIDDFLRLRDVLERHAPHLIPLIHIGKNDETETVLVRVDDEELLAKKVPTKAAENPIENFYLLFAPDHTTPSSRAQAFANISKWFGERESIYGPSRKSLIEVWLQKSREHGMTLDELTVLYQSTSGKNKIGRYYLAQAIQKY